MSFIIRFIPLVFKVHMCRSKVSNRTCFYYNNTEGNKSIVFINITAKKLNIISINTLFYDYFF